MELAQLYCLGLGLAEVVKGVPSTSSAQGSVPGPWAGLSAFPVGWLQLSREGGGQCLRRHSGSPNCPGPCRSRLSRGRLASPGLGASRGRLGDDAAAAVAAAEAGAVAAGAAGAAPAVMGNVVAALGGRRAGVGQPCWALPAATGLAGLLTGQLALDGGSPLGALGPRGLLQRLQGAGPHGQRLRLCRGWARLQLLSQIRPQVSPRDAYVGIWVLDERLMGVHGPAWQR